MALMKNLFGLLFAFLSFPAFAQVSVQVTNPPPTVLESFANARDAVIIKGISHIGSPTGQITYPMDIRVQELINLQNSNRVYGVVVRTKMPTQTIVNYIDYEELEPLLAAIHYIVEVDHNVTPLEHFTASFQTKGGLTISKYSIENRNYTAIRTGIADVDPNIMDIPAIGQFETLMIAAKTKLDSLRR